MTMQTTTTKRFQLFFFLLSLLVAVSVGQMSSDNSVWDLIVAEQDLSSLETAIGGGSSTAAALDDAAGEFTVLAPENDAFVGFSGSADLGFHVIPGATIRSSDLTDEQFISSEATLSSAESFIRVIRLLDGSVYFCSANCAEVTDADLVADNGIVHVIDEVLVPADNNTIAEIAAGSSDLETLTALVGLTPVVAAALSDPESEITVFAPTDAAFAAIPEKWSACLQDEDVEEALTNILLYHTFLGTIFPSFALATDDYNSGLAGNTLAFNLAVNPPTINGGANIQVVDIFANNGVVHLIDAVLLPAQYTSDWFTATCTTVWDFVSSDDDLSILAGALEAAGVDDVLSEILRSGDDQKFTLLAPNNAALEGFSGTPDLGFHLLSEGRILSEDILPGDTLDQGESFLHTFITDDGDAYFCSENCAKVVSADNVDINGVTHVIDSVLVPANSDTITDIVVASTEFTTLEVALTAAQLADVFAEVADFAEFTVFAPNDDAFTDSLTAEQLQCLLLPSNIEALQAVLKAHVVAGITPSFLLSDGAELTTLEDDEFTVTVSIDDSGVTIVTATGEAKVTAADIFAYNGVIHVIDKVIVPPQFNANWFAENCSGEPEPEPQGPQPQEPEPQEPQPEPQPEPSVGSETPDEPSDDVSSLSAGLFVILFPIIMVNLF